MKSAPQKILGINTPFELIEYSGFVESDFRSSTSFLDYDAVVINTSFLATEYDADFPKTYKGKRMITKDDSHRIVDDFIRTKTQIIELLKQGKNVFILMTKNENCFIYTGKTSYSGTGKNARGTDYVAEFDTFSFLPIDINPTMVSGETFNIVCQPPYSVFFQKIKEMIYYDAYFEAPKKSALLTIPNSDKVISSIFEYEKGKIIVLPYLYDEDWFEDEKDWKKCGKIFLDALFELNHILLSNTESYTLPLWSENIKILDEEEIENKIEQERKKIRLLESKMQTHESLLKKVQQKKILITASGTPLEEAVQEILKEIGFSLYEVEKGRSDIIGQYESTDIVAEIKGVSKSAAEKHAAQL